MSEINIKAQATPFTLYAPSGQIRVFGIAPEDQVKFQMIEGDLVLYERSDPSTQYVDQGAITDMPPSPFPNHIFDYALRVWVDPRGLDDLRAAKWSEIKMARNEAEFGVFDWDGSRFDGDAVSQNRIRASVKSAAGDSGFFTHWTLSDNTVRRLDVTDMAAVGAALDAHVDTQHARARSLRAQINATTSAEQLENITWRVQ